MGSEAGQIDSRSIPDALRPSQIGLSDFRDKCEWGSLYEYSIMDLDVTRVLYTESETISSGFRIPLVCK